MSNETLLIAIFNLVLLYFLWFFLIREYFIDSQRHEFFVLRDKLFNYAIENNISFENPAFLYRWNELNSTIRLAHESHLMFYASLFSSKIKKNEISNFYNERDKVYQQLNEEDRKFFKKNRDEETNLFFTYLIKSSLVLTFISIILLTFLALIIFFKWIYDRINLYPNIKDKVISAYDDYQYMALNTK